MRGLTPGARDDQGAYGVLFAILSLVFFGMAAIALDIGNMWQNRRNLITATDAAATAAAQEYAAGGNGCGAVDDDYLNRNFAAAVVTACTPVITGATSGYVQVDASKLVNHNFASLFGFSNSTTTASTAAFWGQPNGLRGLRPFGLCAAVPGVSTWLALSNPKPAATYTITYDKNHPDDCGGDAPGNWGMIDFNGGSNSNNETKDWVRNGYPNLVYAPQWYEGDPGAFSNSLPTGSLLNKTFTLPIFNNYNDLPGANAEFLIVAFVRVTLIDYKANGPEANRYLTLRFEPPGVVQGECCASGGIDTGLRVVQLCRFESNESDCTP